MTLSTELQNYRDQFRTKAPADVQGVMGKATQDLADSGIVDRALKVGDRIPQVTLPDATGQSFSIQAALAQGPIVLAFYRGGWCPYCNLELKALQAVLPDIEAAGATLIAIAPETPDNSLSTREKNALAFAVLSDVGNKVSREFGLVFQLPVELRPIYKGFGIDIEAYNGDQTFELPVPATYVVAPSGEIVYAFADADYTKRAEPADVVATLKQIA
ncbi:MAG: peroxiredoxin-like family protein [Cyanobacteria bacterium P01_F01_bin.4]